MTTIVTNHHWRDFLYRTEVPEEVLADYFDHLPDEMTGYFRYHQRWYHTSDFERLPPGLFPPQWHGYLNDTYFCGVLIQLSTEGEQYRVGSFYG